MRKRSRFLLATAVLVLLAAGASAIATELGFVVVEWDVAVRPGGSVRRTVDFEIADYWDPDSKKASLTLRKQASIRPDGVHVTLEPPWGRRLVHLEGPCPEGPLTFDLQIETSVRGSPLGWIVGPWARDVECGGGG